MVEVQVAVGCGGPAVGAVGVVYGVGGPACSFRGVFEGVEERTGEVAGVVGAGGPPVGVRASNVRALIKRAFPLQEAPSAG